MAPKRKDFLQTFKRIFILHYSTALLTFPYTVYEGFTLPTQFCSLSIHIPPSPASFDFRTRVRVVACSADDFKLGISDKAYWKSHWLRSHDSSRKIPALRIRWDKMNVPKMRQSGLKYPAKMRTGRIRVNSRSCRFKIAHFLSESWSGGRIYRAIVFLNVDQLPNIPSNSLLSRIYLYRDLCVRVWRSDTLLRFYTKKSEKNLSTIIKVLSSEDCSKQANLYCLFPSYNSKSLCNFHYSILES